MSQFWNDKIKSISPYVPGEQPKDKKYIKLNTNENPYPPSPNVMKAVKSMDIESMRLYPDPDVTLLKDEIAKYFNLTKEQIFVGNGSDEILAFIFMTFFNKQDKVYYPDITYSFYPVYSDLFDLTEVQIPLDSNFEIKIEDYFGLDGHIIITNPNAPTSIALTLNKIEAIIVNNPNNLVVVDEAYIDFAPESSLLPELDNYPNLIVLQTFSKAWGMAGIRLGMAFAQPEIIKVFNKVKYPYNINILTQTKALELLAKAPEKEEWVKVIVAERDKMVRKLFKFPFVQVVYPSDANFVLVKMNDARGIYEYLTEQKIIVRDRSKVALCDDCLRITIGSPKENKKLRKALKKLI